MTEVADFNLPFNFLRLMCRNCILIDTYYTIGPTKCKHCGYNEFSDSTQFEDEWVAHQKNQQALAEAEDLVASLKHEIEKFDSGWYSSWNSYSTEQLAFDKPNLIDPFEYFS